MMDLGDVSSSGINDAGQVTGGYDPATGLVHAFLYSNGRMMDLGTLGGGGYSLGYAINNVGQVTGESNTHAFLYSNGRMMDLGDGIGWGINNAGQVTGQLDGQALLYSNGQTMFLNELIDPTLGVTLTSGRGINDNGQIVANGYGPAGPHAFLLTPVPEPGTLAMLGAGLAGLLLLLRTLRRRDRVSGWLSS